MKSSSMNRLVECSPGQLQHRVGISMLLRLKSAISAS
jgi:hypothetical protein